MTRIVSIGGGPGGLYSAILLKKAFPETTIEVFERNAPDDTFGWGVVFSDETLQAFEGEDPESYRSITESFIHWTDIDTFHRGEHVRSTGHGFSGLSRQRLLTILQDRAQDLGVAIHFKTEIDSLDEVGEADLLIAADGVNSFIRERYADSFRPTVDWRKCRFSWLGTNKPLEAFTFIFKRNEHGLFRVHAYPFQEGLGTWIVECTEDTWKNAGLDKVDDEGTVKYCEDLFAEELDGHHLLANRSIWRRFPTITCENWRHGNVVLLGDAVHTAHFSIGSGTKLAMEDAVALRDALVTHGMNDIARTLDAYQEARRVDVIKVQKAADTSLKWFENTERYEEQPILQFTFNLMTRSKKITWDNLALRDPDLVAKVAEWFRESQGAPRTSEGKAPEPVFTPYSIGALKLVNRVVVSPMCQYSADEGVPNDWHRIHYGELALGGAGLIMTEMTNVSPEGRITLGCAGLWNETQERAWKQIVDFAHAHAKGRIGIQLAHAGRKGSAHLPWEKEDTPLGPDEGAWTTLGPSSLSWDDGWPAPKQMDRSDMDRVRDDFVAAAERAQRAGFDLIELHMAHGYLLSSFLSPLSNRRTDEYGGSLANRMRYPLEVFRAVRAAWPEEKPLIVRVTASDWHADGQTVEDTVQIALALKEAGCALLDVSSGGNAPDSAPIYGRMYQVPFAEQIAHDTGIPVMAVGAILGADHANTILAAGRAHLCAMARPHLRDPHLTLNAANRYEFPDQFWPPQYVRGRI